ncbi:efflux RND transporter periplasmic adaptor subunit [Methylopila sp. 73B]|uniref:efflux RND transporter periplasmic adaptor subunit n=1 Tax=Methylopila sp. 73B TaxID=1120792 RepID=UPI00036B508F|nr:efflux RND transporter periplasmic adaptor subunit [Methylopila sp. 73B]
MRTSFIALAALAAVGAGAYAGLNDLLPSPVQSAFDKVAVAAGRSGSSAAAKPAQAPATGVAVEAVAAKPQTVSSRFASVGSLVSEESVQLAAEQPGRLVSINFKDGDRVAANAPVLKFDDTLLMAELQDLEARLALAEANYKRAQSLSKSGYATDTARDQAIADRAIAKAAVELVKVRLGKTEIRAPFDGVVGFRLASVGAYVQAGQPIVNLESIDTLKVDFRVPETRLGDVKVGLGVSVSVDAYPGRTFEGKIYAIDPLVDVNGRALKVRARLDNADRLLRPGLFARVDVTADETQSVVVIPESALVPRGSENLVYRVKDGKAVETTVKLGERRVGEVEIVDGVSGDEMVVVAGQQRLKDGAAVRVVDPARQAAAAPAKAAR